MHPSWNGIIRVVAALVISGAAGYGAAGLSAGSQNPEASPMPGSVSAPCLAGSPGIDPAYPFDSVLAAELPNGTDVVGASYQSRAHLVIVLHAVTIDCRADAAFGDHGRAVISIPSLSGLAEIDTLEATQGGQLLLAGTDGRNVLVGLLTGSGRIDNSFGESGWARFRPKEKPIYANPPPFPLATSVAQSSSGEIFIGGNDDEAHCCAQDFVSALQRDGLLDDSFGDEGSVMLPDAGFQGSYTTDVFPVAANGVLVMGFYEQMGCGGPALVELDDKGVLNKTFDTNARRTLLDANPDSLLFAPALAPRPEGFALLGDVSNSCGIGQKQWSRGLGIGFDSDGEPDRAFGSAGRSTFPSDDAYFGGLWATSVGGNTLLVTVTWSPKSGVATGLEIQQFSANGELDNTFARSGSATIRSSLLLNPDIEPDVMVVNGPGTKQATVVIAAVGEIELLRVQT